MSDNQTSVFEMKSCCDAIDDSVFNEKAPVKVTEASM